jgi:pseudaminic acid biosynthesis-associated methylase
MSIEAKTEQEKFWEGDFGDDYIERNKGSRLLASNISLFSRVLKFTDQIDSVVELGANIGLNLKAINQLLPKASLEGVEINQKAARELSHWLSSIESAGRCHPISMFEFETSKKYDLVLIKTVLIHINPDKLADIYQKIFDLCARYIIIAEYFNPVPVDVEYRGHNDKLFKRDFCKDILQMFPNLKLLDYRFVYHLDLKFPQDNINWFLLEKSKF